MSRWWVRVGLLLAAAVFALFNWANTMTTEPISPLVPLILLGLVGVGLGAGLVQHRAQR